MAVHLPRVPIGIIVIGAMSAVAHPVTAQLRFDLTPYAGVYVPFGKVVDQQSTQFIAPTWPVFLEQRASTTLGARLTVWLSGRLGIEQTLSYAPSKAHWTEITGYTATFDTSAHVITASTQMLVRLAGGAATSLHVGGGIAFIRYGGPAYEQISGSGVAGTLTVGALVRMGNSPLALRFEMENDLARLQLHVNCAQGIGPCEALPRTTTQAKLQHDVVLSLGLTVSSHR